MSMRAVRWEGTDASRRAVVDLYDDLEDVAFRLTNNKLDAATTRGREIVPIGWWLVRRGDAIELHHSDPEGRTASRA